MHSDYNNSTLQQLRDQQVRFAPREKKMQQVARAEKLMGEIDPARTYSYEYLCFRITDYRPDLTASETMLGSDARHDLRRFVEDVSDAANLRTEEVDEPVHTVEDLSRMFNVSAKTISRWRQRGLVGRRFIFDGRRRKRIGFLHSSVEHFITRYPDHVKRGEQFSQLSDEDRGKIVRRARRLAQAGGCPAEVTRRIAQQLDRSVETIRYTLKQFDQNHPDLAVFPEQRGPLGDEAKQKIYQQYRRGVSVEALAKQYCRTKTSIYRIVNEKRAERIFELPLDYMYNEAFDKRNAEKVCLGPMPEAEYATRKARAPSGLPPYLASLYEVPLLTREQEAHLFRKFNYLKHAATKMREKLEPARAKNRVMDKIESLYEQAVKTKNLIVQANLRLVVSIAKRHIGTGEEFFQLISDGNMSLIRAVEKFDYGLGNKFSTYASWAIMKNFARTIPGEFKHRDRFRTSLDEMLFATAEDERSDQYEQESAQRVRKQQIFSMLSRLDEREQKIIISRFGLMQGQEPRTLKQVGAEMGVTKERIRQIEVRALNKLRVAVTEEKIELPD